MAQADTDHQKVSIEEDPHGGRFLLGGMAVSAAFLLALIGHQTVRGSEVSGRQDVGWWAEPGLMPTIFLGITLSASIAAFFTAKKDAVDWSGTARAYGRVAVVSACMICTVFLLKIIGFALSLLVFAAAITWLAGFRGWRLIAIAFGAAISVVLIFRVGFSVWFPRPELFKLVDLPFWLQGIL